MGLVLVLLLFYIFNVSTYAYDTQQLLINPGGLDVQGYQLIEHEGHYYGTFTANDTIDFFITNITGYMYYGGSGIVPSYALFNVTAQNGTYDTILPLHTPSWFICMGNYFGANYVNVTLVVNPPTEGDIPGFEFLIIIFGLFIVLGFVFFKKNNYSNFFLNRPF